MARERMITRTIVTHEVSFLAYNLNTKKVEELTISFGVDTNIESGVKGIGILNDRLSTEGKPYTAVQILKIEDNETLYGMPEIEFLKVAKILPPRSKDEIEG